MKFLSEFISIRSMSAFLGIMVILAMLLVGVALWQISLQKKLSTEWLHLLENSTEKLKILEEIHNYLGYGGLIHDYKNFLLRREEKYNVSFHSNYTELIIRIDRYSELVETSEEQEALASLQSTIEEYHLNFGKIAASSEELSIQEIDRVIRIDDSPALLALNRLDTNLINEHAQGRERVSEFLAITELVLWISLGLVPVILLAISVFPLFVRNLTREIRKRRFKEERLRKTSQLLARAERVAGIGHWRFNPNTEKLFWSKEVFRIHGLNPDESTPTIDKALLFFHPEDRLYVERCVQEAIDLGKSYEFEARIVLHNGSIRTLRAQGYCEQDRDGNTQYIFGVVQDITDQVLQQQELRRSEAKLRAITEHSHDAIMIIDPEGMIQYWNHTVRDMFGYSEHEMIGQHIQNFVQLNKAEDLAPFSCNSMIANETTHESYCPLPVSGIRNNGSPFPIDCNVTLVKQEDEIFTVLFIRDNTIRQRTEDHLIKLATTDPLTGALNRRFFMHMAMQEITRSNRYGNSLSVIAADLDHFKIINDTFGHAAGDIVLKQFVLSATSLLRDNDLLARSGGEEFLILLPETGHEDALVVAERLKKTIAKVEVPFEGRIINCTVSLGVASLNMNDKETYDALMKRVDDALYEAKRTGRNKYVYLPAV